MLLRIFWKIIVIYVRRLTRRRSNPSQAQGAPCEVSEGEDVRQTKVVVVCLRVKVEEVTDVYVSFTELVYFAVGGCAVPFTTRVVVDLLPNKP